MLLYVANHALAVLIKSKLISLRISLVLIDSGHSWMCQFTINFACYLSSGSSPTAQCVLFWCWIQCWIVFVLGLVCLITVDIIGYSRSHSPPTFLHSSNTKYGAGKSARTPEGKRHIPQNRKNSTTVPELFWRIASPITLGADHCPDIV